MAIPRPFLPLLVLLVAAVPPQTVGARDAGAGEQVRVAVYDNRPKIFPDREQGADGLFPELLRAIAAAENWQLEWVPCVWSECLEQLGAGRVDLVPDVAYSIERDQIFDFHRIPVADSASRIYARRRVDRPADLHGLRVAVVEGAVQRGALEGLLAGGGYQAELVAVASFSEAFEAVRRGRADAAVVNDFFGSYYHREFGLMRTAIVLNAVSLYFATARGHHGHLLEAIDRQLEAWRAGPSPYYAALERWTQQSVVFRFDPWLRWLFGAGTAVLLGALAFIGLLRVQVRNRTRHIRAALEQLASSERKYRELYESMLDGFVHCDANGRILEANQAFLALCGHDAEALEGLDLEAVSEPGSWSVPPETLQGQLADKGYTEVVELALLRPGTETVPVEMRLFGARAEAGQAGSQWAIVRDMRPRREAEAEQSRMRQQLEQARRLESVGRLAGGVAHDFNNMLGAILGGVDLQLLHGNLPDEARAGLQEIREAAEQARGVAAQLLLFARRHDDSPRLLDPAAVIESQVAVLRRLLGERIDLKLDLPDERWLVRIDPVQLGQVLSNLCLNARDAIGEAGEIRVAIANVPATAGESGAGPATDCVQISVCDQGEGMTPEVRAQVFEPFFTTKDVGQGTGLGLSIVYGIVTSNGGTIEVESEPGQGACVRFCLPRQAHAVTVETGVSLGDEMPHGQGERVLVVEDEPLVARVTQRLLANLGYEASTVAGPQQALERLAAGTEDIDLLLTDLVMPGLSGAELAVRLREERPALRVLFMSGYSAEALVETLGTRRAPPFLQKPFSAPELARAVRAAIDGAPVT